MPSERKEECCCHDQQRREPTGPHTHTKNKTKQIGQTESEREIGGGSRGVVYGSRQNRLFFSLRAPIAGVSDK